ncbi:hypothetical protein BK702_03725 [Bacillus thuringiensis serovar cameroun]|nr:hypothetical protein BK702_03725 [Bacillus thuringiensis serovar cameroun]
MIKIGYHTSKSVLSGDSLGYYHSSKKTDFFMHSFLGIYAFCNTLQYDKKQSEKSILLLKKRGGFKEFRH